MFKKIVFYCDEAGAKAFADQDEAYAGEVGVFAGILVPEEELAAASARFDAVAARYRPTTGKLHIADLPNLQKEALRSDVYREILQSQLPCFWYAIHSAGLHADYRRVRELMKDSDEAFKAARRGTPARVKMGSPRDKPASMHVELFSGLYSHVVAFLMERGVKEAEIEVRTDRIDSPIVKEFEEVAHMLMSDAVDESLAKGFDTFEKKVVARKISICVRYSADAPTLPIVRQLSIDPVLAEDGLVLAADVLANSLNYHFKSRPAAERYMPLNRPEAVATHPLATHLDAFLNWGTGDLLGDGLYRHPSAPNVTP